MDNKTYYKSLNVYGKTFNLKLIENDCVSNFINEQNRFYEDNILENLSRFLPSGKLDVGLDIGANIGNHTIFFSKVMDFNAIYSFEPQKDVYEILDENIKLNNCSNVVSYNMGLSNTSSERYSISRYLPDNLGSTAFSRSDSGDFVFKKLDDVKIEGKIDFIKMDVEEME